MHLSIGTKRIAAIVALIAAGTGVRAAAGQHIAAWEYGLLGMFAAAVVGFAIHDQRSA